MATIDGEYMGMGLRIDDLDVENVEYFKHCAAHDFHLQACAQCSRLRYPPTTACPWCMSRKSTWKKVEGKGAVHSYTEVHHAIQPAFRGKTPYMVLLVDLDTQKGEPTPDEALRVIGNLCTPGRAARAARDGEAGRRRHPRPHGVQRRLRRHRAAAMDDRRDRAAAGKGLALRAGISVRHRGCLLRTSRVFRHRPIAAGRAPRCGDR